MRTKTPIKYNYIPKYHITHPTYSEKSVSDFLRAFRSRQLPTKKHAPLFFPAIYASQDNTLKSNVISVTMIVIDIDSKIHSLAFPRRCDINPTWLKRTFFAYTTFSHTPDSPRWRMVIPLEKPIPAEIWARKGWKRSVEIFGEMMGIDNPEKIVDSTCKNQNRGYYYPSHPLGAKPRELISIGSIYDLDPDTIPEPPPPPKRRKFDGSRLRISESKTDFDIAFRKAYRRPDIRLQFAEYHGLRIDATRSRVSGFRCPSCDRSDATYYYVEGVGIYCRHLNSCPTGGHAGSLIDLAQIMGDFR